jgi:hypothetical protein
MNAYGTWEVTTEGDCEGRSTSHLGTYTGYVDEIALHLANKCEYKLTFKKVGDKRNLKPTGTEVHIGFDIDSKTWDSVKTPSGLNEIKEVFKGRDVIVSESNYYAGFKITSKNADDIKREMILNKLTEEEKVILGLK